MFRKSAVISRNVKGTSGQLKDNSVERLTENEGRERQRVEVRVRKQERKTVRSKASRLHCVESSEI